MALRTTVKLFPVGRHVCVVIQDHGHYVPVSGSVTEVSRGRIYVTLHNGVVENFSPNDRHLNLTREECDKLCRILNGID